MPKLNLTNITIKKLEDRNFNTYYLITKMKLFSAFPKQSKKAETVWLTIEKASKK